MTVPTKDQLTFVVQTPSSGTWKIVGEQPSVRPDQKIECVLLVKWIDPKDLTNEATPEYRLQLLLEAAQFATADSSQRFEKAVKDYVKLGLGTIRTRFDPVKQCLVETPFNAV